MLVIYLKPYFNKILLVHILCFLASASSRRFLMPTSLVISPQHKDRSQLCLHSLLFADNFRETFTILFYLPMT